MNAIPPKWFNGDVDHFVFNLKVEVDDPPDPYEVFTTTDLNLAWFDGAESHDGPATVMRIVIDVSDVEGADVSSGFGSVYFGAKIGKDDIQVADLASDTFTAESAPSAESLSGNFWVKGE